MGGISELHGETTCGGGGERSEEEGGVRGGEAEWWRGEGGAEEGTGRCWHHLARVCACGWVDGVSIGWGTFDPARSTTATRGAGGEGVGGWVSG